jgi:hypothetical protein
MEKKTLLYHKLEKKIPEMQFLSKEGMQFDMSTEAGEYFEGFGDKVSSVHRLDDGKDSTIYMVKLKGFDNRTQLVKVYDNLERRIKNKKDLFSVLREYYRVIEDLREYLKEHSNPLNKKTKIWGSEYLPEFSVSQRGILVEKNNHVGSWIRSWVPGKNFKKDMFEIGESGTREITGYVNRVCYHLSEVLGHTIDPNPRNYKIIIDHEEMKIKITFTDLANSILDFVE